MQYAIKAYGTQRGLTAMTLEAATPDEARALVLAQGMDVISIEPQLSGLGAIERWLPRMGKITLRRRKDFDLLLFSQELRSLLEAGLSLIESLGALARKEATGDKRTLIESLIRHLREGKPFSIALREFPEVFPPLYLALTSASEQTGNLAGALERFVSYRSQMDTVRKRIVSSAIYPALLIGVGSLVILFLMTYVVPRFSRIYEDFGRDLPFMSKLLLQWGSLIEAHGLQALAVIGVAALIGVPIFKKRLGWRGLLRRLLAIKALQSRVYLYAIARFYRTLGMLQQGGIPIVDALGLSRELLSEDRRSALDQVTEDIRSGIALSVALERQGLAPPVASDLLQVGEKTGDIGEKMLRIADFYDEDLSRWTEWFVRLFEPLLMLFIGLFIAFVVVLLYLPIFELAGSVQ
ncbi:MAG TPA: type II secretion system F family protein [Rhodocyclaceae bacterium]|nr:type II secretion system F family protein [Rhodocyclaceae bacterium]